MSEKYAATMMKQMRALRARQQSSITEWHMDEDEAENVKDDSMEILCLAGKLH